MPEFKLDAIETWQSDLASTNFSLADLGASLASNSLAEWFELLLQIQTASITQNDFYQIAAQALTRLIGLDRGLIILKKRNQWHVTASSSLANLPKETFDPKVIQRVEQERATFYETKNNSSTTSIELDEEAYVASPIFDATGSIAGVLYGFRALTSTNSSGVQKIEALVVQLLAGIVSSGIARQVRQEELIDSGCSWNNLRLPNWSLRWLRTRPFSILENETLPYFLEMFVDLRNFPKE